MNYIKYTTIFVLIFSYLDLVQNKHYKKKLKENNLYKNIKLVSLLIIHNIIFFGIYFTLPFFILNFKDVKMINLIFYLILLVAVPIHWYTNNNKCWFTVEQNKLLDINVNTGFRDFISILTNTYPSTGNGNNNLNLRDKLYFYYLFISIAAVGVMIYIKHKKNSK